VRVRRSGTLGAVLALASVGAVALALPGGASAATVTCSGKAKNDKTLDMPNSVSYSFTCNEDIIAYTLASSKQLDYFNPAPVVFDSTDTPSGTDTMGCEGGFPSYGFGCNGKVTAGNHPVGDFATIKPACGKELSKKAQFWVVAVAVETVDNGTTQTQVTKSSEPFKLGGLKCRYPVHHNRHH